MSNYAARCRLQRPGKNDRAYFAGTIPLGVLFQTASAFNQVQGAFSFFVRAYATLAEYRSVIQRLTGFETAIAAANQLQAQIVSMQQQIDVAKQNAANALAAGQSNQAAALQAQIATLNSQLDALKANQAAALSTATTNAGLTQQASQTNAQLAQNQAQFGATQQLNTAEKNQQTDLMQQQLNNQQYLGMTQLQQQAYIATYQAMLQQQQLAQQQAAANQAFYAQLIAAGGTALAASDVTLKTDISDGARAALDFLDALPDPVTYRYKDERAHYLRVITPLA